MSTDRAPKKTLKDKRSKLEKILDKVSGMGITKSELSKAIRGMKSMNRGNPGVAGASTTKTKKMGPPARKPAKEIPVVDPMRYGGMVKKKKKKGKK